MVKIYCDLKIYEILFFYAGILEEGKHLNQEFDAQRMADQLRATKNIREIQICAARLYSVESFLYKLVNATLRNKDMSKVDTLGPFCYLLRTHVSDNDDSRDQLLYRGMTLSKEMIDEYKQSVGTEIIWPAFTSTTKDRRVAELFGNTLFIIDITEAFQFRSNISAHSNYPHEQEVLLEPDFVFKVDKIERDPRSGKYLIYMSR